MLKFLACLLTIVAVVGGVLCQQTLLPGDGSVDVWHVLAHDDVVNEKVISYQQFQAVMQATLDDLGTGAIRLEGAAARVHDAARIYWPHHLEAVQVSNPGRTIHESVARNLLGHMCDREATVVCVSQRLPDLELDLAEIVGVRPLQTAALMPD